MRISEIYTEKSKNIQYPMSDPKRIEEIEDMAGKKKREEAKVAYQNEIKHAREIYHEEVGKINREFKLALFKEYGVENNPKAEKAFSMAWEEGHSYGYGEVEMHFEELVELIK